MRLLSFTLVPLALGAVAFAAYDAGELHERVLEQLEQKLEDKFVGDFEARRLTGSLIHGFTAHDVEIRDGRGEPVLHVDEFQVEASAFALLDGDLRFDKARLVRPTLLVERWKNGDKNVEHVFKSRRPSNKSRPAGKVLFEMADAEVVDGKIYYVNSTEPKETSRVVSTRDLQVKGSFRVLSGKTIDKRIDELDALVVSNVDPTPRLVYAAGARVRKDPANCDITADILEVDARWRIDNLDVALPRDEAPADALLEVSGRASSRDGAWLDVSGKIDRDDDSYAFDLEAHDFSPRTWPGAPDWSWLVLDGKGTVAGRGWSRDEMDTTVRWRTNNIDLAGERVDTVRVVAHANKGRLHVETLDIKASETSVDLNGYVTQGGNFAMSATLDTTGNKRARQLAKRLDIPLQDATRLRVSTKAKGKLDLDARSPLRMIAHADTETKWSARDLVLDGNRYGASSGSVELLVPAVRAEDRAKRMLAFNTKATLSDVRVGHNRAKSARLLVSGAFRPAKDGAAWPIEAMKARGGLDLVGYRNDDLQVKRVAANLNVRGDFPLGKGTVTALLSGIRSKGKKYNSAQVKLRLLDDQRFRLESKTKISVAKVKLPIYLDVKGRHVRNLEALAIDKLILGRPGMRWRTHEPGLVIFEEDQVVVKSLVLKRAGRKVRLDGAYGSGKSGSLSEITSRLKSEQIKGIFGAPKHLLKKIF